jgi:hypothetical protein
MPPQLIITFSSWHQPIDLGETAKVATASWQALSQVHFAVTKRTGTTRLKMFKRIIKAPLSHLFTQALWLAPN